MDDREFQEIKKRCDAATAGPWEVEQGDVISVGNDGTRVVEGMQRHWTAMISQLGRTKSIETCRECAVRDIDFIAHARQDIPALLSEVERLTIFEITQEQADKELEEEVSRLKDVERLKTSLRSATTKIERLTEQLNAVRERLEAVAYCPMPHDAEELAKALAPRGEG